MSVAFKISSSISNMERDNDILTEPPKLYHLAIDRLSSIVRKIGQSRIH